MKLIVGLGNPGRQYHYHRHNAGFLSLDYIAQSLDIEIKKRKFNSRYALFTYNGKEVLFVKPLTFMNLSGNSIKSFISFFKISAADDILVIVDDVNLPFGKLRIRKNGSAGGHNGIQSIIDSLKTDEFVRLRVGINKPEGDVPLKRYVLSPFSSEEKRGFPKLFDRIKEACFCWLENGVKIAMQEFN